jgi:bifunctional non-homologous end joining protein LigD
VHEIKHDGFRMMVRRDPAGTRLLTRRGNDWTQRYPLITAAVEGTQGAVVPDRWRSGGLW